MGRRAGLGPIAIGLIGLAAFVWWELRTENPLLDVTAFSNRGLASGSLTITLLFAVMFGIFLVLFPFLQTVLGWSAVRSATGMLPMAAAMMPMSTIAPRIAARIGHRTTMLTGLGTAIIGLSTLAVMASVEGGYLSILPGLLLLGLGMGLSMTPSTEAITATLPTEKQGVASALNDTSRELGGAVGVALLGSLLTSGYSDRIADFASQLPAQIGQFVGDDYFLALGAAQQAGQKSPTLAGQIVEAASRSGCRHRLINQGRRQSGCRKQARLGRTARVDGARLVVETGRTEGITGYVSHRVNTVTTEVRP